MLSRSNLSGHKFLRRHKFLSILKERVPRRGRRFWHLHATIKALGRQQRALGGELSARQEGFEVQAARRAARLALLLARQAARRRSAALADAFGRLGRALREARCRWREYS